MCNAYHDAEESLRDILSHTNYRLDPEYKKRWVEALRSGKYKQIECVLKSFNEEDEEPRYCCLGVFLEINAEQLGCTWKDPELKSWDWIDDGVPTATFYVGEDRMIDTFPTNFCRQLRMPVSVRDALTEFNDNGGTFLEIADYVEKYL